MGVDRDRKMREKQMGIKCVSITHVGTYSEQKLVRQERRLVTPGQGIVVV